MSSLTDEQRKMIEEKKKVAQAKLAAKFAQRNASQPAKSSNNQCTLSKTTGVILSPSPKGKIVYNVLQNFKSKLTGTCELTSKERFTIHVRYHKQLIDTFKTIQSKLYGK